MLIVVTLQRRSDTSAEHGSGRLVNPCLPFPALGGLGTDGQGWGIVRVLNIAMAASGWNIFRFVHINYNRQPDSALHKQCKEHIVSRVSRLFQGAENLCSR